VEAKVIGREVSGLLVTTDGDEIAFYLDRCELQGSILTLYFKGYITKPSDGAVFFMHLGNQLKATPWGTEHHLGPGEITIHQPIQINL
jgi:hypothetical protein